MIKKQSMSKTETRTAFLLQAGAFVLAWLLYGFTVAPGTLFGDPSEYQFIPAIFGIAHPPGYAFYTLVAGLWQRLVPVGSVALRTNLLAATAGAWTVSRVAAITYHLSRISPAKTGRASSGVVAPLFAAALVTVGPDLWQHSIHANAHVMSVALTTTQLWLLICWALNDTNWNLYLAAFVVGLGVTHHPITVWGIPAYVVFVLIQRPRFLVTPRLFLPVLFAGLLGLTPWVYFPLRSPQTPFGPKDMATFSGFLRHATAQGLRTNLFHFGWRDQWNRVRVFLSLANLQYWWPLLALALIGITAGAALYPRIVWLLGLFMFGHLVFTMNSVQDVMAYLLHPFLVLGVLIGLGADHLLHMLRQVRRLKRVRWLTIAIFLLVPALSAIDRLPKISLRTWDEADTFVENLTDRFAGQGGEASFVSDWEHLTPLYYHLLVENEPLDVEDDLRPVFVSGDQPWAESVFANLPEGPVYLPTYRREIRELGFRLRPQGDLWQVLEPPAQAPVSPQHMLNVELQDRPLEVIGYDLSETEVYPGGVFSVIIYARVYANEDHILTPFAEFAGTTQRWTTDSRRLTPDWIPGEIIAEKYNVHVPFSLSPGTYKLRVGYSDMTAGVNPMAFEDSTEVLKWLGDITVLEAPGSSQTAEILNHHVLTNIGNDVALMRVRARTGGKSRRQLWQEPLPVRDGQPIHLTLTWQVLQSPRTSYTVFIHLIDATGRPWFGHDYTPLGGAFPSYLWFPKWLKGQRVCDPYRLTLPEGLPSGQYWLEVGIYEMGTIRRIPQFDVAGNMIGDRLILGPVTVR